MPAVRRARGWYRCGGVWKGMTTSHQDIPSPAGGRKAYTPLFSDARRDSGPAGDGRDGARDLVERLAIRSLLAEHLTGQTPAQAYIIAWRRAWDAAIGFCIDAEQALDREEA